MGKSNEINDFGHWIIPSGEGVVFLEGRPTEEERALNRLRTAKRRENWKPNEVALSVYNKMKLFEGKKIIIQLWNKLMWMCPEEGPLPFICEVVAVSIKKVLSEGELFDQLFIEFKNPVLIENGNCGGNPISENNFNTNTGSYTYNCMLFGSVLEYFEE